jgi:hypothetical protein
MPDELTHRQLAVAAYNATWELLEKERTPEEDLELLDTAFASRHHWRHESGASQLALGDWMISRCFAALGDGQMAVRFAESSLALQPADAAAWLRASLLEGLARAHAANRDRAARDLAVARSAAELALESDAEDRALIQGQLDSVPAVERG